MRREGDQLLALPGPWPCSCGGILPVPPVGPGAGWPEQQENVSQVRGCLAHQDGLSAGEESGQWPVCKLQQVTLFVDESAVFWWVTVLCVVIYIIITPCSCPTCLVHSVTGSAGCLCYNVTQTQPFSIDSFFHSVLVGLMIAINLNIIFKASAVRWLRKGGQAEHPCSREKRSGRNLSADTPRDVVRRGQGSNTPVGQESGC